MIELMAGPGMVPMDSNVVWETLLPVGPAILGLGVVAGIGVVVARARDAFRSASRLAPRERAVG